MRTQLLSLLAVLTLALPPVLQAKNKPQVTEKMISNAVHSWCDGLLLISKTDMEGKDAVQVAKKVIDSAYNYDQGKVLFNPTLSFGDQTFRLTKEGALAYFVGGNDKFPNDSGFARKNWVKCEFDTAGVMIEGNIGIYMGNVHLTNLGGQKTTVDKTFVFKFVNGKPKIILHKSALPFNPQP
jgi:hypothetical protein